MYLFFIVFVRLYLLLYLSISLIFCVMNLGILFFHSIIHTEENTHTFHKTWSDFVARNIIVIAIISRIIHY